MQGCRLCKDECPDQLVEHLDEIYDAIEDEYGDVERIRYDNENYLEPGEKPASDDWPVLSSDSGVSWFEADQFKYLRGILLSKYQRGLLESMASNPDAYLSQDDFRGARWRLIGAPTRVMGATIDPIVNRKTVEALTRMGLVSAGKRNVYGKQQVGFFYSLLTKTIDKYLD